MLETILICLVFLFISCCLFIYYYFQKFFDKRSNLCSDLKISVVVAAKNEENNIPVLVSSLSGLDYPEENYEVIIVDDGSEDNTFCVSRKITSEMSGYMVIKAGEKELPGKKGALSAGISCSKNPFIVITDADCVPGKDWLKSFSNQFDNGNDFVFGPAPFYMENFFINKLSCFENLRSSILTFALAEAGLPYSAAARSFGFKKSSFEKINGYKNTAETLGGDDDLLLREAVKNKMNIGTFNDLNSLVFSKTKTSLSSYLKQKSRHTKTSVHYLPSRQLVLGIWHVLNLLFLFSPLLAIFNPLFLLPFFLKIILDMMTCLLFSKRFSYTFSLHEIIYLQICYEILIVINFFSALFRRDKW